MEAAKQRTLLTDLPIELLFLIFRQCIDTKSWPNLRLICHATDEIAIPVVFESLKVIIWPSTSSDSLETLDNIFGNYGNHIRTLIISNVVFLCSNIEERNISRKARRILGRGFSHCTQLRNLVCSDLHGMFSSRTSLSPPAPVSLTSLSITPMKTGADLSYCLLALKDSLRSLEIRDWKLQHGNQLPFHLPSFLPHLTDLILTDSFPPSAHLEKLFSCITAPAPPQSATPIIPLRSLNISTTEIHNRFPTTLTDILSILSARQFGSHLRTLRVTCHKVPGLDPTMATALVRACPNLVEFAFHCNRVDKSLLSSLPCTLAVLELVGTHSDSLYFHGPGFNILSSEFLALWLRDNAPLALRSVSVQVFEGDVARLVQILGIHFDEAMLTHVGSRINLQREGEHFKMVDSDARYVA